ncbi:ATP-dependent DNA ligase [Micromonospora sp. NPDC048830]|uniref:ATP-dependent DNA ligase n=1 Tax=Micromonospora sp. NPDC048830 TaxID=3364257 RepID=UPI003713B16F
MSPARRRAGPAAEALRRPVAPMLAAPVDAVPVGPDLLYEPKWDGWRAITFQDDRVHIQSRAGRNLTPYFPDITRAVRALPPGVVLDGELVVWDRGRTNFALLQRRVTAGRDVVRLAARYPAHYVLFDLLADAGGQLLLDVPLVERRARLAYLLAGAPPQLTLTPQTDDLAEVSEWLTGWTAAGIEGVVIKRRTSRYEPGRRGWGKFRVRATTEAIIGGVTGSVHDPSTALLGRFDRRGRLRYTGRTGPLATAQRRELAALLSPLTVPSPGAVVHPWPAPLPASWSGQWDQPEPLRYVQVQPTVVVDIGVDTAFERGRWRHQVRYNRARPDLSPYAVPLLLGEGENPFTMP